MCQVGLKTDKKNNINASFKLVDHLNERLITFKDRPQECPINLFINGDCKCQTYVLTSS